MLYTAACSALGRIWPLAWIASPCSASPVVCATRSHRVCLTPYYCVELVAPWGLHLLARLLLWPFALLDWAVLLPRDLVFRCLSGIWRLPNFTLPWPPLP